MMVYINRDIGVKIKVIDDNCVELDYIADETADGIEVQVHLQETTLNQFQQAIQRRHPELTAEIAEIRNDLDLQNGLVRP